MVRPPITVTPMAALIPPFANAQAHGDRSPRIVVKEVIRMGRNRSPGLDDGVIDLSPAPEVIDIVDQDNTVVHRNPDQHNQANNRDHRQSMAGRQEKGPRWNPIAASGTVDMMVNG